jgi:excisionase family DNA binding protein
MKVIVPGGDLPPVISVERAAELMGMSRSAAYRAAASGGIPVLRCGRRMFVPSARLLDLLRLRDERLGA